MFKVRACTTTAESVAPVRRRSAEAVLQVIAMVVLSSLGCNAGRHADRTPVPCLLEPQLGGSHDASECVFADVTGLALDPVGHRVAIVDAGQNRVQVFAASGGYQFSIGRNSEVEYDWKCPCCASFDRGGRLWVAERDTRRYRYVSFRVSSNSGQYASSIRMPSPLSGLVTHISMDTMHRIVHWSDSVSPTGEFRVVRSLLDTTGAVVGQYMLPNSPPESVSVAYIRNSGSRGLTGITQPYGPAQLRAFGPNGETAEAISSHYSVLWYDGQRRLVRTVQGTYASPEVSVRERQRATRDLTSLAKNAGVSMSAIPFGVPRYKTPLQSLGFDLDGRLWVELSGADGQPHQADVYARFGPRVGRYKWPADVRLDLWTVHGQEGLGIVTEYPGAERVVALRFEQ